MLSLLSGSSEVLLISLLTERYLLFFADEAEDSVRLLLSRGMIKRESCGSYEALDAAGIVGEAYCVVHAVAVELPRISAFHLKISKSNFTHIHELCCEHFQVNF